MVGNLETDCLVDTECRSKNKELLLFYETLALLKCLNIVSGKK